MHSSASKSLSPSTSSNAAPPRSLFTIFGRAENVHRKLLYELMSTVYEYLVVTVEPVTVANAAAAAAVVVDQQTFHSNESLFIRIHRCVEQIFLNGLRMFKPDVSYRCCWRLISFAIIYFNVGCLTIVYLCRANIIRLMTWMWLILLLSFLTVR